MKLLNTVLLALSLTSTVAMSVAHADKASDELAKKKAEHDAKAAAELKKAEKTSPGADNAKKPSDTTPAPAPTTPPKK
jgi:sRNA-binding protein